jgi:CHRD domain
MKKILLPLSLLAVLASVSHAAVIAFELQGTAGIGLLAGSEPAVLTGGSGGEIGSGITFDDVSNQLIINVGWGSSQGFTDLTSTATASHIHGPTASNNGSSFTQTAGVLFNLTRSSSVTTGGTINQLFTLSGAQATDLLNGKYYINIHTTSNGGGEMRGFLVQQVPETSASLLGMFSLGLMTLRRRRA